MATDPPKGCAFIVGDVVEVTNPQGAKFSPHRVTGFTLPGDECHGRTVYIDWDCYWMPTRPASLRKL